MSKLLFATVAVILSSWVMVAPAKDSDEKTAKPPSVRIEMGKGHFARDSKAFHYWDKEK